MTVVLVFAFEIAFLEQSKSHAVKRVIGHVEVIDHHRDSVVAVRVNHQGDRLDNIDFCLKQSRANAQERLRRIGQLDSDQVAFNHRQPSPFKNLTAGFGIAKHEPDDATLGGIIDINCHNSNRTAFKSSNQPQELTDSILQENRKLPNRREVTTSHGFIFGSGPHAAVGFVAHSVNSMIAKRNKYPARSREMGSFLEKMMTSVNWKPMAIFENTVEIRVRYQETDGQRRLHHANYINYFEIGRVELLRLNGISYKDLEDSGVILVVAEMKCQYFLPADFDDLLSLTTRVTKSKGVRIYHEYELRKGDDVIAKGESVIACVNPEGKVSRLPDWLLME